MKGPGAMTGYGWGGVGGGWGGGGVVVEVCDIGNISKIRIVKGN